MPIQHRTRGDILSDEQAQEMIRRTIEQKGRFILHSPIKPTLGEVQNFAGLPMRMVRFVSYEDAKTNECPEIWRSGLPKGEYYFEVEVAD